MKAKDLNLSVWDDNEGNLMTITKVKGGYYGENGKFDFQVKTAKETFELLKKWGCTHIGWGK